MKFHKSYHNKVFYGVCGGLAETFGINAWIIRGILIFLNVATRMPIIFLYFIAAMMLPYGSGDGYQSRGRQERQQEDTVSGKKYRPEAPPFDVSDAQDVEIDSFHPHE